MKYLQYIFAIGTLLVCIWFVWLLLWQWRQHRIEKRNALRRSMMKNPRIIIGTLNRGQDTKPKRK